MLQGWAVTDLQKRLLDLLRRNAARADYLSRHANEPLARVYEALVALESLGAVRVLVPRNKKPEWSLAIGF